MPRFAFKFFCVSVFLVWGACLWADQALLLSDRAEQDYGEAVPPDAQLIVAQVAPNIPDAIGIAEFWMDPASGRFLANVISEAGRVQRVSGVMQILMTLPVPSRRLMPGDMIAASDLSLEQVPVGQIGSFVVRDDAQLVGMKVRRMLQAGRPIMEQSVIRPYAVLRGARVTIAYYQGAMRLRAPGRALGDAHIGEPIRVVNLSSNKTITATAKADGLVEVYK